jgi:hypothetical protein
VYEEMDPLLFSNFSKALVTCWLFGDANMFPQTAAERILWNTGEETYMKTSEWFVFFRAVYIGEKSTNPEPTNPA